MVELCSEVRQRHQIPGPAGRLCGSRLARGGRRVVRWVLGGVRKNSEFDFEVRRGEGQRVSGTVRCSILEGSSPIQYSERRAGPSSLTPDLRGPPTADPTASTARRTRWPFHRKAGCWDRDRSGAPRVPQSTPARTEFAFNHAEYAASVIPPAASARVRTTASASVA